MTGDTLFATNKTQFFRGSRFDIQLIQLAIYICTEVFAHSFQVRQHLRLFGNYSDICIAQLIAFCIHHLHNMSQQLAAICPLPLLVCIGKMLTYITEGPR